MNKNTAILWLKFASLLTIGVGLVASMAAHPATDGLWLFLFDLLAWPVDGNPGSFQAESFALNAVLGGLMVGWGVTLLLLAGRIASGQTGIARVILMGLLAWFFVDSAGSLVAGIPGNVVLNISFLVLFLPPLLVLMRADDRDL